MSNREHRPKPKRVVTSQFDNILPGTAGALSAKDHIHILKESRWNSDYQTEYFKSYFDVEAVDELVYSNHRCSMASALVIRYVLPDFITSKGLHVDRIAALEGDGDAVGSFSNIEVAPDENVSRLVYGNYFVSNDTDKYIIHLEEGYQDDFKIRIASRNDSVLNSHKLMEELLAYAKENNFLKGKKIDPHCQFIKFDKKYSWDDLILSDSIKNDIRKNLQNLIEYREVYRKNGLQVKRGLILSSAPGTGKSTLFKVLCNQIDWTVLWVTPKHLESAKKVASIIELAKELSPTILLLEDIDIYGGDRATNHNPAVLGEMMNQLDGVQDNTDIITIATTNNKEALEKALLDRPGRFDKVIDFPLPDVKERRLMLKVFSNGLVDENLKFLDTAAKEYTKGMTGAQVRELVNMAIIYAVDEKAYDKDQVLTLTEGHFKSAVSTVKSKDFSKVTGFSPRSSSSLEDALDRLDDLE